MSTFLDELRAGLSLCGVGAGEGAEGVLVAVSGGADSVALLCGLHELAAPLALRLTAAHLDHGLRGEQSRADAAWVEYLCRRLGIACFIGRADLASRAQSEGLGLEEAGRRLRSAFLASAAERAGCRFVALGHTADDQVETILHHIVRGTGLAGLRGMPRRRPLLERLSAADERLADIAVEVAGGQEIPAADSLPPATSPAHPVELIRPLLDVRRDAVRAWLAEIGQDFRDDPTNLDERFTRNRIRHKLLPLLEREFNPDAAGAVLRLARQAAEADEALSTRARQLLARALLDQTPTTCRLDCRSLAAQPPFLVREVFRALWTDLGWPRQSMGYAEWARLAQLAATPNASATLPGPIQATRRGDLLILSR